MNRLTHFRWQLRSRVTPPNLSNNSIWGIPISIDIWQATILTPAILAGNIGFVDQHVFVSSFFSSIWDQGHQS